MAPRSCVDVRARGSFWFRPQRVVPATALNPFTRPGGLDSRGNALLHLVERFAANEIDVELFKSAGAKMHVSVVEAGHDEMAAEIDDLGFGAFKLLNVCIVYHAHNLAIGHSNCLHRAEIQIRRRRWPGATNGCCGGYYGG